MKIYQCHCAGAGFPRPVNQGRARGPRPYGFLNLGSFLLAFLVVIFFCLPAFAASKEGSVKNGNALYQKENFAEAAKKYEAALEKDPQSDIINFDLGTAYYKKGNYEKAIDALQKALLSDDTQLRSKTQYNLGNTFYKLGLGQDKQGDTQKAVSSLEQSLERYQNVLSQKNDKAKEKKDPDAQHNYDAVKKVLEELKQKLQKQQQQQSKGQEDKNKDKQQQEQQKQEQQNAEKEQQEKQSESEKNSEPDKKENSSGSSARQQQQQKDSAKTDQEQQKDNDKEPNLTQNTSGPNDKKDNGQQSSSAGGAQDAQQPLSSKEAEMLLRDYQQDEEPKGLLNFMHRKSKEVPVGKDW